MDDSLKSAFPNSPEMYKPQPARPVDPKMAAAFPNSPEITHGPAVESDPDIGVGGVHVANEVITMYGTPELRAALTRTGLGNDPSMVKLLAKVGRALKK